MKKRIISFVLCLALLLVTTLCVTACSKKEDSPNAPAELEQITVANPVAYFSMSMHKDADNELSISAFAGEENKVTIQYVGQEKKVGDFDARVFHNIADAAEKADLAKLNGQTVYDEGEASAYMYVEFADGSTYSADFTGTIPEDFSAAYEKMDTFFNRLTAGLPAYVPQAQVMGEVNPEALSAMQEIHGYGIDNLDSLSIYEAAKDEFFGHTLGLSNTDGIANGIVCAPNLNVNPYSLVIVTLNDGVDVKTVAADFEASMDWRKWVCVAPSNALIAYKNNKVLCVMGSDNMYQQTASAVANAGWTEYKSLRNPDM